MKKIAIWSILIIAVISFFAYFYLREHGIQVPERFEIEENDGSELLRASNLLKLKGTGTLEPTKSTFKTDKGEAFQIRINNITDVSLNIEFNPIVNVDGGQTYLKPDIKKFEIGFSTPINVGYQGAEVKIKELSISEQNILTLDVRVNIVKILIGLLQNRFKGDNFENKYKITKVDIDTIQYSIPKNEKLTLKDLEFVTTDTSQIVLSDINLNEKLTKANIKTLIKGKLDKLSLDQDFIKAEEFELNIIGALETTEFEEFKIKKNDDNEVFNMNLHGISGLNFSTEKSDAITLSSVTIKSRDNFIVDISNSNYEGKFDYSTDFKLLNNGNLKVDLRDTKINMTNKEIKIDSKADIYFSDFTGTIDQELNGKDLIDGCDDLIWRGSTSFRGVTSSELLLKSSVTFKDYLCDNILGRQRLFRTTRWIDYKIKAYTENGFRMLIEVTNVRGIPGDIENLLRINVLSNPLRHTIAPIPPEVMDEYGLVISNLQFARSGTSGVNISSDISFKINKN